MKTHNLTKKEIYWKILIFKREPDVWPTLFMCYIYFIEKKRKRQSFYVFLIWFIYYIFRDAIAQRNCINASWNSNALCIQMYFVFELLEANRDRTEWYIRMRIIKRLSYVVYYGAMLSFFLWIIGRMQALIFNANALHVINTTQLW